MNVTYELLLRLVAQVTHSNYLDLVFTGSRRYEFGENQFINSIVELNNKQDIDIVFPVSEKNFYAVHNSSEGYGTTVITKSFRKHDMFKVNPDPDYPSSTISGYIEILGYRINLIGRPENDVVNWKFATRVMSELWETSPKLKYDREYRVKIFKMLRKEND